VTESGNACASPRASSLFALMGSAVGNAIGARTTEGPSRVAPPPGRSGTLATAHENPEEQQWPSPPAVLTTASGLQAEQALVGRRNVRKGSRQIRSVTSGKRLALRAGPGGSVVDGTACCVGCRRKKADGAVGPSDAAGRRPHGRRSPCNKQSTQNCCDQVESDCLIKTKQSDGAKAC